MISKSTAATLRSILSPTLAERLKNGETSIKIAVGGGIVALAIAMAIAILWLNGVALQYLWELFVVPIFKLPNLSIAQAIGILLVVQFLTKHLVKEDAKVEKKEDDTASSAEKKTKASKTILAALAKPFMKPLSFIIMGWILHTVCATV
jgi:hypothetical protein